jgi:hypothetical protein
MTRQLALAALLGSAQAAPVQLRLGGAIGRTEDNFICVNMDWWPVSIPTQPAPAQPAGRSAVQPRNEAC